MKNQDIQELHALMPTVSKLAHLLKSQQNISHVLEQLCSGTLNPESIELHKAALAKSLNEIEPLYSTHS